MASEEEFADLQRLSNDYAPDLTGPLVGQRQSSDAITAEYAQADPIYVHKTAVLPQKYSHYRTIRGDGNCGWRALAFGYFEALQQLGDPARIASEIARLKSLNNLISAQGYDEHTYIDFVEETFLLLHQTAASLPCQDDGAALLTSFNDESTTGAIIVHFRLITAAWMKTNAELYQDFLPDETIDQFCKTHIDPFTMEIDHLGINALIDAIIKPAGIAVDILYLDRSEGEEVNTISFGGQSQNSVPGYPDTPSIRLLYRPGHYDILYKIEDMAKLAIGAHAAPQIHYMADPVRALSRNLAYSHSGLDLDTCYLPGLSFSGISSVGFSSDPYDQSPRYTPMDLSMTSASIEPFTAPIHPIIHSPPVERLGDSTFRPSKFQVEPEFRQLAISHTEPCQTEAMKQAGECAAHYMNERFQPQIWEPGSEYRAGKDGDSHPQSRRSS